MSDGMGVGNALCGSKKVENYCSAAKLKHLGCPNETEVPSVFTHTA